MRKLVCAVLCFLVFGCAQFEQDPSTGFSHFERGLLIEVCHNNHKYFKLPVNGSLYSLTPILDDSGKPILCKPVATTKHLLTYIEESTCACDMKYEVEVCTVRVLVKRSDKSTVWVDTKEECKQADK